MLESLREVFGDEEEDDLDDETMQVFEAVKQASMRSEKKVPVKNIRTQM